MKYTIPKTNIKVFHKALLCMGKVSQNLFFEPCPDKLQIKALNSDRTAFFNYSFLSSFFTSIQGQLTPSAAEPFRCKVLVKSILLAFSSIVNTEKTVESCLLEFSQDSPHMFITKQCRYEVCSKYTLPVMEHDTLTLGFSQSGPSFWVLPSKFLSEVVGTFRSSQMDINVSVSSKGFHMNNRLETFEDKDQVNTELNMYPGEFEEYSIQEDTAMSFSLRELRSLISFSEASGLAVRAEFSVGGQPITFSVAQEPFIQVTYALSTMAENAGETGSATKLSKSNKTTQPSKPDDQGEKSKSRAQRHSTQRDTLASSVNATPPSLTPIHRVGGANDTTLLGNRTVHTPVFEQSANPVGDNGGAVPEDNDTVMLEQANGNGDVFVESPPAKRARPLVFSRCFDATFNPAKLNPGTRILAPASDEEDES